MKNMSKFYMGACIIGCMLLSGCSIQISQEEQMDANMGNAQFQIVDSSVGKIGADGRYQIIGNYPIQDKMSLYENNNLDVTTMYLTVSMGNAGDGTNHTWEEINTYSAYDYDEMNVDRYMVEGLLQIGDENGPAPGEYGYGEVIPNATVSIRGQTSTKYPQKNYKIKIKENKERYQEQRIINLNKHMMDGLRFRNKLCYDLMNEIPEMMGARTEFVHLYVRDLTAGSEVFQDYGLYTKVEQINKTYLKTHGLDKEGQLYKINFFEFFRYEDVIKLRSESDYDEKLFEKYVEIKGNNDHSKLIALLEELNDYSVPIETVFSKWFDEENFFSWMAFQILVGNKDTQSRNTFLYSPLNIDKWYLISWDNDTAFERTENELKNRSEGLEWENGVSNYWGNVLFSRVLKSAYYRELLDQKIDEYRGFLTTERIQNLCNEYEQCIRPYVLDLPDIAGLPVTVDQREYIIKTLPLEIEKNYQAYRESLRKPQPFFIGTPTVIDGGITVTWDPSFTFDNQDVTYFVELSRSSDFSDVIFKADDLYTLQINIPVYLETGAYFIRVKCKNESGYEQCAFDTYVNDDEKIYGTLCFYVLDDGSIQGDIYEEN